MGTAVPVALLGHVQPVLPSLGFSGSWNTLPLPSARRTERCGVLVAPPCPVAPPPISSWTVPPGGTLLLSALPGALPSRCVGGPPRPAFMLSGDTLGHPGCQQPLSSHWCCVLTLVSPSQWYPSLVAPRGVGADLLLLKSCVFQLLWSLFCLLLSRKGTVLVILVKPLTTFCCRCFLGTSFRGPEGGARTRCQHGGRPCWAIGLLSSFSHSYSRLGITVPSNYSDLSRAEGELGWQQSLLRKSGLENRAGGTDTLPQRTRLSSR